jgi:3-oxoadipate enol-lactonase
VEIIDRGHGDPIVIVPGIQGRWPYVDATINALAGTHRVLSFSLAGERKGRRFDPERGLDNYVEDIAAVLATKGLTSATIVGISFGGLAALRFAAVHPRRTTALVLVSTPGPDWAPSGRHVRYLGAPRLFGLLFLLESPARVAAELRTALPSAGERLRFSLRQLATFARAPLSFTRMAHRAALAAAADRRGDASRVHVPTLVVSGEKRLDRVVPTDGTLKYVGLIHGARAVAMTSTGHLGSLTQPGRFAAIVCAFLNGLRNAAA